MDDDDDEVALLGNDDIGNYDAEDAMLEFAERYFNAHPAQFSQSAIARTVNIVTRKSLNVSISQLIPIDNDYMMMVIIIIVTIITFFYIFIFIYFYF